ncbi:MAG TPA: hypothetical protein VJU78_20730 [Chitinophagaceae bacterium]|nr:hypothetical protein [Chitinophagaceae bacterium]
MRWIILTVSIFLIAALSCNFSSPGTYTEFSRTYSPDSARFILKWEYVQGAWDGGRIWMVSIVKATDSARKENHYSLTSLDFDNIYWKGNDTVVVTENLTNFLSEGKSKLKDTLFDGVYIKVIVEDPFDSSFSRKIIYQETSPNKKYDLYVYRYVKAPNKMSFLNISVVNKNDSIPKFGNFYITRYDFDCFDNIKWDNESNLDIKVSESCYYAFADYLVKNRPQIKYKVKFDNNDTLQGNVHPDVSNY